MEGCTSSNIMTDKEVMQASYRTKDRFAVANNYFAVASKALVIIVLFRL